LGRAVALRYFTIYQSGRDRCAAKTPFASTSSRSDRRRLAPLKPAPRCSAV